MKKNGIMTKIMILVTIVIFAFVAANAETIGWVNVDKVIVTTYAGNDYVAFMVEDDNRWIGHELGDNASVDKMYLVMVQLAFANGYKVKTLIDGSTYPNIPVTGGSESTIYKAKYIMIDNDEQ